MENLLGILIAANKMAEGKTPLEIAYIASLYSMLAETLDALAIQKDYMEEHGFDNIH